MPRFPDSGRGLGCGDQIDRRRVGSTLALLLVLAAACCPGGEGAAGTDPAATDEKAERQGLLTAYMLLEDTLSQESKLGALAFLRKITFRAPVPELQEIMHRIADTSDERLDELERLRALPPDVSAAPDYTDPIGEAITGNATDAGMKEMLALKGPFGIRFVLLQAQATRMIASIASAAADLEVNERRRKWLRDLSKEYESIRDELVDIVERYVLQQGAAQQESG
jgi:hypothetical protein